MALKKTKEELLLENMRLRERLAEAEDIVRAIRYDRVDAVVVFGQEGHKVYTLRNDTPTYRILLETISEGTVILSSDGSIFGCNRRFSEMVGEPLEIIAGSAISSYVPADNKDVLDALIREGKKGSSKGEIYLKAHDGSRVPVFLSINPLQLEGGPGICLVVTDLTEQKRNEDIIAAGKLAQTILEQAGEAIVVCNENGVIIQANAKAVRLCGRNPMLQDFDTVLPLHFKTTAQPFSIAPVLKGESFHGVEAVLLEESRKNPNLFLSASPLRRARDGILGCVVTLTDITELKRVEGELLEAYAQLEKRVQERTHELNIKTQRLEEVNTALKILLKQREEDRAEFEETILTNVKNLIAPYLEKLKRTRLSDEQATYCDILDSHMNEIVSPFARKLSKSFLTLTSVEIQVANLIKEGKTTKEIAAALQVSENTVVVHRYRIRTKLGLKNTKINLASHLKSLNS